MTVHTDGGRVNFSRDDIDACGFISGEKTYSWTGGQVEADLCIVCTGATQAAPIYADSGLDGWLDERGQVKVKFSGYSVDSSWGTVLYADPLLVRSRREWHRQPALFSTKLVHRR